ncbi:MAG: SRPBCC family protein [Aldersonia sp.]|nr:SRPBCC family protein [Aldersonia sp.]
MTNPTTITATPGLPYVEIVREFDAPVSAVFRAHVEQSLYEQWLGCGDGSIDVTDFDASVGGRWAYVTKGEDMECNFHGVFHKVEQDRLIVQTFEFSLAPDQVGVDTTTFEDLGGRTRLVLRELYPSVEARDAAMSSGMEHGIEAGYKRLDDLLAA